MHETIAEALKESSGLEVRTATLQQPEHGLTEDVLDQTDVLTWWGHVTHGTVEDKIVVRIQARVLQGMGLVILHSDHYSNIFRRLLGTTCSLTWREAGEKERVWFRSGCTWKRGNGKIFYFRPGHKTYPTYHHKDVRRIIQNAVHWALPEGSRWIDTCPQVPIEKAAERITQKGEAMHQPGEAGFR